MKKTCRRCGLGGHLSYDCRTPRCSRCGEYKHAGSQCRAPCKQCGEGHPTSRCPVNRSVDAATADTVNEAVETVSDKGGGAASPQISNFEGADTNSGKEGPAVSTEEVSAGSSETHLTCLREVRDLESRASVTSLHSFGENRARGVAILFSPKLRGSIAKCQRDDEGRILTVDVVLNGRVIKIANSKDVLGGTRKHQPWKAKGL
ncbi:unnamed protein product, partial [Ixodes hexagonus]